jgi:nitric oxide synthase-interacting protein
MTRHARNCTAGAVYTYHEKKKDAKVSGYGSQALRLGKDSMKDFDCCCLTLQPCREPVITPQGFLYDKESILEYILHQKKEYARQMKEYEKQKKRAKTELEEIGAAEHRSNVEKFLRNEKNVAAKPANSTNDDSKAGPSQSISNMTNGRDKHLPSFWIPNLTPAAKETVLKKPDKTIYCPMSGKPLKLKDLIPIKFIPINDPDDSKCLITKQNRYMCAVTHDVLNNTTPCAMLKTSSCVVTMECVEKLIKQDMVDPINGMKITDDDIIPLKMGGTGYASTNDKLFATEKRPVLQA